LGTREEHQLCFVLEEIFGRSPEKTKQLKEKKYISAYQENFSFHTKEPSDLSPEDYTIHEDVKKYHRSIKLWECNDYKALSRKVTHIFIRHMYI